MPNLPTPAQSAASRLNGVRHGLTGRTFFLLPDEDPEEFRLHEAQWLAEWRPRDLGEREAALAAVRAMWREMRGDRLEALVLGELFAAGKIADVAEREAARAVAFRQLGTLLRYQARIARELRAAMATLDTLRQRRLAPAATARRSEPDGSADAPSMPDLPAAVPMRSEPERSLNRHQRRALAAMERAGRRRAA